MQEIYASFCIRESEKASRFVRPTVQKCYSKKKTFVCSWVFFTVNTQCKRGEYLDWLYSSQHFNTRFIKLAEFPLVTVEWQMLMITQGLLCGHLSLEVLALERALLKDTYYETEQAHLLLCKTLKENSKTSKRFKEAVAAFFLIVHWQATKLTSKSFF